MFTITNDNQAMLTSGSQSFATGSRAKLEAMVAVMIATASERLESLNIPANKRPNAKAIQEAIRKAFGGADKEADRGRFETAGLAFRALSKMDKEHGETMKRGLHSRNVAALTNDMVAIVGQETEQAFRAWVAGESKPPVKKSAAEQITAFLVKKDDEITFDEMVQIATMVSENLAARRRIAEEIEERNAEKETAAA